MTVTDRTDASEQEFRDRIAAFESAPTPPEVREAAAPVSAYRATQDGGAEVARLSPDGLDVAIRRAPNIWHVSNGGHYRDLHVADWTPLAPQAGEAGQ